MVKNLPQMQEIQVGSLGQEDPLEKGMATDSRLERVWRKGNPLTLLVGMQTSTATMENSVEIP